MLAIAEFLYDWEKSFDNFKCFLKKLGKGREFKIY
jgi:hypothetical protein